MSSAFLWNAYFETGVAEVDAQHRHLVDLLNHFGNEIDSSTSANIDAALKDLTEYTVYHFNSEERLMLENAIAAGHQEHHILSHRRFINQVADWIAKRQETGQFSLKQLVEYLSNWLVFHILGEDQAMGRQIAAIHRGASPQQAYLEDKASDDPRTAILLDSLSRLYGSLLERNERLLAAHEDLKAEHKRLEQARNELAMLNAELEQRVLERTEQLQSANDNLREQQNRLIQAEKMAAVGQLAAGFAHEINTPMGIAVGTVSQFQDTLSTISKLLTREEVREEDLLAQLEILDSASSLAIANLNRASGLVKAFKRSSIDQVSEQATTFRLCEVIQDDLLTLRSELKHSPVRVEVECPADLELTGIPGIYHQIFTNLILNALQHGFANTATDAATDAVIRITARGEDRHIRIEVSDNGRGMTEDVRKQIFQPFFTTNRSHGGSGLGLYICYDIVTNRLGGTIDCRSATGQGTHFLIDIPASS